MQEASNRSFAVRQICEFLERLHSRGNPASAPRSARSTSCFFVAVWQATAAIRLLHGSVANESRFLFVDQRHLTARRGRGYCFWRSGIVTTPSVARLCR